MSKIVKYCNSCEEGFAAKFGFCPNCGNQLQAFEMNPLNNESSPAKPVEAKPASESVAQSVPVNKTTGSLPVADLSSGAPVEKIAAVEAPVAAPPVFEPKPVIEAKPPAPQPAAPQVPSPAIVEQPAVTMPSITEPRPPVTAAPKPVETVKANSEPVKIDEFKASKVNPPAKNAYQTFVDGAGSPPKAPKIEYVADSGYYVTVIEEKNGGQRNKLLLASLVLICVVLGGAWTYSLFAKDLLVGSIDQGDLLASVPELVPMPVDDVPPPKNDKAGGGGGGGGKNEADEPKAGRLPTQVKDPQNLPDPNKVRITNPSIVMPPQATKGDIKRPSTDENTGVPNGLGSGSGRGSGGGIGNGFGTGVGNGRGGGEGNGIGDGSGNGIGDGNGNGRGSGDNGRPPAPPAPPAPKGPSKGLAITSKPRANYTDSARQAQVQGTVTLRVTFNANGTIGGISPVSGLPNGLTEQAIAAARSIRFEPAMVNGVPQTVTKQVQYSFTIY